MCREANKARGVAECFIRLETHSEYNISGDVRGYTGTLTGLLYVYGAFQTANNKSHVVSPSLLQISLDLDIHLPSQFDVGMDDWMSPPCEKKARILGDATNSQTG